MRRIGLIALFTLLTVGMEAQVVNIEAMRARNADREGTHGYVDGSFYLGGTQNLLLRLNGSANIRHGAGRETYYAITSANFSTRLGGDNLLFEQNGFLHGRYNYRFDSVWTAEAFFQWQSNIPMRIAQRYNIGVGPRYRAIHTDRSEFFLSPHIMYELDVDYVTGAVESVMRMSTYAALNLHLGEKVRWNSVLYYQPKFGQWEDVRMTFDTRISTPISPQLNLVISGNLRYDAFPSGTDVPQFTFGSSTGLSYRF